MKAADIPDDVFMEAVRRAGAEGPCAGLEEEWAMWWDVTAILGAPDKVVLAKARKLIRRGLLGGCACGCRGDWYPKSA